jgi:hypothetical protein
VRPVEDSADSHKRYTTSLLTNMKTSIASVLTDYMLRISKPATRGRVGKRAALACTAWGNPPPPPIQTLIYDTLNCYVTFKLDGFTITLTVS